MESLLIKNSTINLKTGEMIVEYHTEEEMAEIKARQEEKALESALIPSEEDVEEAEFELKLLNKLTDWGII